MRAESLSTLGILCSLLVVSGCGEVTLQELPEAPVLSDVQALVLLPACATAGCHDASAAGDLDLSDEATSRAQMVGVLPVNKAAKASMWLRVKPGAPEESFLYRKIVKPGLGEGAAMPIGLRLTEPYVQLVERWITQGAL